MTLAQRHELLDAMRVIANKPCASQAEIDDAYAILNKRYAETTALLEPIEEEAA